ncbi:hypothetical protein Bca101_089119 [Brassica carinata]
MQHMFSCKSEKANINEPKEIALKLPKPLPKLKVPKLPKVPKLKVKEPKVKAPDGPPVGSPDWRQLGLLMDHLLGCLIIVIAGLSAVLLICHSNI